jgi:SynChlorMet cassette radical SAM/SPASM protein ScmF
MVALVKNRAWRLHHVDPASGFGVLYRRSTREALFLHPFMVVLWRADGDALEPAGAAAIVSAGTGLEVPPDRVGGLVADLRRRGVLLDPDAGDREDRQGPRPAPGGCALENIYFYATRECNARCYHCYQPVVPVADATRPAGPGQLGADELLALVASARPLGLKGVKITGGEPFLRRDMAEIVAGLGGLGLQISIETNGTLVDERMADLLVEHRASVSLSMDGASAATHDAYRRLPGSFEKVLATLRLLAARGGTVKAIMSVSRRNLHELEDVLRVVRANGGEAVKINPVTTLGLAGRLKGTDLLLEVDQIVELFRRRQALEERHGVTILIEGPPAFCSVSEIIGGRIGICPFTNILGILADGSISYCGIGNARPELVFGHVRQEGFDLARLWREAAPLRQVREDLAGGIEGVCGRCVHQAQCKGACRALAYDEYESFVAPHVWCQRAYERGLFPEGWLLDPADAAPPRRRAGPAA